MDFYFFFGIFAQKLFKGCGFAIWSWQNRIYDKALK